MDAKIGNSLAEGRWKRAKRQCISDTPIPDATQVIGADMLD
jgi:hypothetical protein